MLSTSNVAHVDHKSANEHLGEVAEILAPALLRARLTKSTPLFDDRGEKFVDLSDGESGHAPVSMEETVG